MKARRSGIGIANLSAVSFRIDVIADTDRTVVRVAGRLNADAVAELLRAIPIEPSTAVLDLAEVQSIDPVAGGALRSLREQGAELVGVSPYLHLLLSTARPPGGDA